MKTTKEQRRNEFRHSTYDMTWRDRAALLDDFDELEARAEAEKVLIHRPSSLDLDHTACGLPLERFPVNLNLQIGEGETCSRCTHVVAAIKAARREGEKNRGHEQVQERG